MNDAGCRATLSLAGTGAPREKITLNPSKITGVLPIYEDRYGNTYIMESEWINYTYSNDLEAIGSTFELPYGLAGTVYFAYTFTNTSYYSNDAGSCRAGIAVQNSPDGESAADIAGATGIIWTAPNQNSDGGCTITRAGCGYVNGEYTLSAELRTTRIVKVDGLSHAFADSVDPNAAATVNETAAIPLYVTDVGWASTAASSSGTVAHGSRVTGGLGDTLTFTVMVGMSDYDPLSSVPVDMVSCNGGINNMTLSVDSPNVFLVPGSKSALQLTARGAGSDLRCRCQNHHIDRLLCGGLHL